MAFQAPEFLDADYWARNRGRLLGLLIAAAVVLFGILFFQNQREARAAAAWDAIVDEDGRTKAHIQLEGAVADSDAEPWALFQDARSAFIERDLSEAEDYADRLVSGYSDHVLNRDGRVQKLLEDIRAEKAWVDKHPPTEQNPDVDDTHAVTIRTSLGPVKIGLYPEQAPEAVSAFLGLVRDGGLTTGSFHQAQAESWIAFSSKKADAAEETEGDETGEDADDPEETDADAEPSKLAQGLVGDRNALSHFEGSVSFLRDALPNLEPDAVPRIAIYLNDTPYKDGQEVVFGRVLSGLDTLRQTSTREASETTNLKEPLAIEGIDVGTALAEMK